MESIAAKLVFSRLHAFKNIIGSFKAKRLQVGQHVNIDDVGRFHLAQGRVLLVPIAPLIISSEAFPIVFPHRIEIG